MIRRDYTLRQVAFIVSILCISNSGTWKTVKNMRNQRNIINICVKLNDFTNLETIAKAFTYALLVGNTGLDTCRKRHINESNLMVSKKERIAKRKDTRVVSRVDILQYRLG